MRKYERIFYIFWFYIYKDNIESKVNFKIKFMYCKNLEIQKYNFQILIFDN